LKGKSDRDKFERARNLKKHIGSIRSAITKGLQSKTDVEAQLFTATWIIDNLALRVGGEKDDDEADTVGCCSLRTEHVEVTTDPVHTFKLDFLGKDSIRYTNEITLEKVRKGEEQNFKRVVENIIKFKAAALARQRAKHGQAEDIFELTPSDLNDHLRVRARARGCTAYLRGCVLVCVLSAPQGLVSHIPGMKLSAKVFRTFNASQCLAEQL
jgi:DNA topoisomerase-1